MEDLVYTKLKALLLVVVILAISHAVIAGDADDITTASGAIKFDEDKVRQELSDLQFNMKSDSFILYDIPSDEQDDIDLKLWDGVSIRKVAGKIGDHFRTIANEELGVTYIQGIFDSLSYSKAAEDLGTQLEQLAAGISSKIDAYRQVLLNNKALIQNLYKFHKRSIISQSLSCCQLNQSYFKNSHNIDLETQTVYSLNTSLDIVCDLLPAAVDDKAFNPGRNLTRFSQNVQKYPGIKWQYFITQTGIHNEFPAYDLTSTSRTSCSAAQGYRHRDVYVSTVNPVRKNVVIVIDTSMVLSESQILTAKTLAKQIVKSLSASDKVSVVALSNTIDMPESACNLHALASATQPTKQLLIEYIDLISRSTSLANHTLGFDFALSLLPEDVEGLLLYVSRGLMNSLTEAKDVLSTISQHNSKRSVPAVIHTFGLIDDTKTVLYEKTFLQDIAVQDFSKYSIKYTGPTIRPGNMSSVCCPEYASSALNYLFQPGYTSMYSNVGVVFSVPYNDLLDKGLVISLSTPCIDDEETLIGVAGVDLLPQDVFDQILYPNDETQHIFIVDNQGYVLAYPDMEDGVVRRRRLTYSLLTQYEKVAGFDKIAKHIMSSRNGTADLLLPTENSKYSISYTYNWCNVDTTPYKVVSRIVKSSNKAKSINTPISFDSDEMVYHRLDLGQLPSTDTCLHYLQLASFSTSAFFLSPRAFENPYEHISEVESRQNVQNYLAYLTDSSSYISKPGMKDGVKNEALVLSKINSQWIKQWRTSSLSEFIVRRYLASTAGVYRMFPATLTRKLYDPVRSQWYKQATRLPGRITLTRPYIDSAGAGYIVSLSHSIYEGRSAALHSTRDPISAVVGADFSSSYFERVLYEYIPSCSLKGIRCFILDDKGYLITHPKLSLTDYHRSNERQHMTHVEPVVAHAILGHKSLVSKRLCNSLTDGTIQRYYQFNTSLMTPLTNLKSGEQCLRYQMSIIPGSNAFIVMVNETCDIKIAAFCPCSVTDRLCLNCHRMEQAECECPCECPLYTEICPSSAESEAETVDDTSLPIADSCDVVSDNDILFKLPNMIGQRVAQCVEPRCSQFTSELSCLGIVGCSWCEKESDGITVLSKPFCGVQQVCFGGIMGARTPYNDQITALTTSNEATNTLLKNTPVGPITGAILGLLLLVALGIYCCRHNMHNRSRLENVAHNTSNASAFSQEYDGYLYNELPGPSNSLQPSAAAGHMNLFDMELPNHISPYRVNEDYRPPRPVVTTTESSDHGYSTMTAHDEADSSSTSCMESLKSGRSRLSNVAANIKLPPPPKSVRKLRQDDYKKLLSKSDVNASINIHLSPNNCNLMNVLSEETTEETMEPERTQFLTSAEDHVTAPGRVVH